MHSLVFSHLDYCNALLVGIPKYQLAKLQRVQNFAARTVLEKARFTRATPLLMELHWLPVEYRITFKVLLLTHKALYHISPVYIKELIIIKPSRNLRSDSAATLIVPRVKHKTVGERSFARAATTAWNKLPTILRQCKDTECFKCQLKPFLLDLSLATVCKA